MSATENKARAMTTKFRTFIFVLAAACAMALGFSSPALAVTTISPSIDVRQYGAACDGTTDDTAAFNSAFSASATAKVSVVTSGGNASPATTTSCYLASSVTIPVGLYFSCEGPIPGRADSGNKATGNYNQTSNSIILNSSATLTISNGAQI